MRVRNVVYSPLWSDLGYLVNEQAQDGFALSHVVKVDEYKTVLVFMKPDGPTTPEEEESEVEFGGDGGAYL